MIEIKDIKKQECQHPMKHLQTSCGCCLIPNGRMSQVLELFKEPTQQHLAEHLEWDNGIEHPWDEKLEMIPVPELVLNEKLLKEKGIEIRDRR